jgi:hypothetical protein
VEVEGDVGAVVAGAAVEGALEDLVDHVGGPSDLLLALLRPDGAPLLLRLLQLLHLPHQHLVPVRVLLYLRNHYLVQQVHLPELLVVAVLLVVLRVN